MIKRKLRVLGKPYSPNKSVESVYGRFVNGVCLSL